MSAPRDLSQYLRDLHDAYVDKVNRLVAEDREELIQEVVDAYAEEALQAIADDASGEREIRG